MQKYSIAAICVVAALALAPAAHAQDDFDKDGDIIGVTQLDARVGFNTTDPITVTTNAATNVGRNLDVYNNATLEMPAGDNGLHITANGASKINMSGGKADFVLTAADNSVVTITGGYVANSVSAMNSGKINFSGGSVNFDLTGADNSVINLDGGAVGRNVIAFDKSTVTISKGSVKSDVGADNAGVVTWTGGNVGGYLFASASGIFRIHGSGLSAAPSGVSNGFNLFTLSGHLLDGTDITGKLLKVQDNNMASYQLINGIGGPHIVPESSTIAFSVVALGGILGLLARKRRVAGVVSAVVALILAVAPPTFAQDTEYNNDGDVIGTVIGDALIGDAPVNPPITVSTNGATTVIGGVLVYNTSKLNIHGGKMGDIFAFDSSVVNLYGGSVGDLYLRSNALFCIYGTNLSADTIDPNGVPYIRFSLNGFLSDGTDITGKALFLENGSLAEFKLVEVAAVPEPGAIAFGFIAVCSVLGMMARKRRAVGALAASAALLLVGASAVNAQTTAYNNDGDVIGIVVGDAIIGDAPVDPPITVYANGATIVLGGVVVQNDSIFEMDAGIVSDIFANGTSVVNVRGGKTGNLFAFNASRYCLFGSGLSVTLVDPNYGQFVKYTLSGHLSDGGDLAQTSLYIDSGSIATFKLVEVPEPSAVAFGVLAAGSVVGLIARKRKA